MNKKILLSVYKKVLLIRKIEESVAEYCRDNKIMSFTHFSIGQEMIPAVIYENLTKDCKTFGGHRGHSLYLSSGACSKKFVAEILGKKSGYAKGSGGSMHCVSPENGLVACTPILGPVASIGAGAALAKKLKKEQGIIVSFLGDGASETGAFYETCNFVALHKLPFLMVIENNLFSVNTHLKDRRSPLRETGKIVTGFGLNYQIADGNSFQSAYPAAQECIQQTLNGNPTVLEMMTHREYAHSAPIWDERVRIEDKKEIRQEKDCLKNIYSLVKDFPETSIIEQEVSEEVFLAMEYGINAK